MAWPAPARQGKLVEQHRETVTGKREGRWQVDGVVLLEMLSLLRARVGDVYQRGADGRQACDEVSLGSVSRCL